MEEREAAAPAHGAARPGPACSWSLRPSWLCPRWLQDCFVRRRLGTRQGVGVRGRISSFPSQQGWGSAIPRVYVRLPLPLPHPTRDRERVQMQGGRKPATSAKRKASIIWAELSLPLPWDISGRQRPLTWGEEKRRPQGDRSRKQHGTELSWCLVEVLFFPITMPLMLFKR